MLIKIQTALTTTTTTNRTTATSAAAQWKNEYNMDKTRITRAKTTSTKSTTTVTTTTTIFIHNKHKQQHYQTSTNYWQIMQHPNNKQTKKQTINIEEKARGPTPNKQT